NPLEAALLDCAVLLGPRVENFRDICADMVQAEAALQVGDEEALAQAVDRLLGDEALRRGLAEKAAAFARAQSEVVERALTRLGPFLEAVGDRRGAP
ncbi:MAG: 3-deoxy-D-manno-octulosonic acid transferase, partial [Rhodospirillales bacterium]|nr:3-deoxy-D-manno-octulosonic acid transferase [Rhodospirillales bacterium]